MKIEEKYIPSRAEIRKARQMMTLEEKQASKIRQRFVFQIRDPLDDFVGQIDDKNVVRRLPTAQEKVKMNNNLTMLGELFKESNIRWCLDGALNISLMKGQYIGLHKDIDISLEKNDLEKLDSVLIRQGYGLFLSNKKDPDNPKSKNIMERVHANRFRNAQGGSDHLIIAAIDKQGRIKKNEPLNFIDVHLVERDQTGSPVGPDGVNLPSKWFKPQPVNFHGTIINLSHPARVAYYKIRGKRKYDMTDLQALAEAAKLNLRDVKDIEDILEQEANVRRSEVISLLEKIKEKLMPEINTDQIFQLFLEEPRIARFINQILEPLRALCKKIKTSDKSIEEIIQLTFNVFGVEKNTQERHKKIDDLKKWVARTCSQ